jgi:hypothetical protein
MPPHDFWKWLKKEGRFIWLLASAIPLLGFSSKEIIPSVNRFIATHDGAFEMAVQLLHASIVLIVIVMIPRYPVFTNVKVYPRASERLASFRLDWIVLWIAIFSFYAVMSLRAASRVFPGTAMNSPGAIDRYWFFVQNLVMNFSAVYFLFCYLNLAEPSGPHEHDMKLASSIRLLAIKEKRRYIWLLFVTLTFANMLCTLGLNTYHGARVAFMIICGLASGVGLALLTGRFESRYINAPRFVLAALYVYAVNQSLYAFYDVRISGAEGELRPYISLLLLPLKLILFAFVSWLMKSGTLLFYLTQVPDMDAKIKDEWEQFRTNAHLKIENNSDDKHAAAAHV